MLSPWPSSRIFFFMGQTRKHTHYCLEISVIKRCQWRQTLIKEYLFKTINYPSSRKVLGLEGGGILKCEHFRTSAWTRIIHRMYRLVAVIRFFFLLAFYLIFIYLSPTLFIIFGLFVLDALCHTNRR